MNNCLVSFSTVSIIGKNIKQKLQNISSLHGNLLSESIQFSGNCHIFFITCRSISVYVTISWNAHRFHKDGSVSAEMDIPGRGSAVH